MSLRFSEVRHGQVSFTIETDWSMTYFRKPQPHHPMIQRLLTLTLGGYVISVFACVMWSGLVTPRPIFCASAQEPLIAEGEVGRYGGRLVVAERTEPRTLNPITAVD